MYFWKSRIFEGKLLIKKQRMKKGKTARNKSQKKENYPKQGTEKRKNGQNKSLILRISLDTKSVS
jgi:hypothetical protein